MSNIAKGREQLSLPAAASLGLEGDQAHAAVVRWVVTHHTKLPKLGPFLVETIFSTDKSQISVSAEITILIEPIFPLFRFGNIGSEKSVGNPADIFENIDWGCPTKKPQ